jgi:hypothetical protein
MRWGRWGQHSHRRLPTGCEVGLERASQQQQRGLQLALPLLLLGLRLRLRLRLRLVHRVASPAIGLYGASLARCRGTVGLRR